MKLRVRSVESGETIRIEVPNPCSIHQLKAIVSSKTSSSSSIRLSLNKKDELRSSSPDDSLQSLGITSGDLIFFTLNPQGFGFSSLSPIVPPSPSPPSNPDLNALQTLIPSPNSRSSNSNHPHKVESVESKVGNVEIEAVDTTQIMEAQGISETTETITMDEGGPVVEPPNSFSVPCFLRKVFTAELGDEGGPKHKLLVIAVHAALLESGFVGFDPVSKRPVSGFHCQGQWPSSVFTLSLYYTLPEILDLQSNGLDADKVIIDTAVLKFQSLGKFLNVYGSLLSLKGSQTHWARLNEDHLVPLLNVVWANCSDISLDNGLSGTSPEKEVFEFWKTVKDKLALPLSIDLCEKVGLPPPTCFARLPIDLKLKILESLPGIDIAKVGCVSCELRYLASNDDLWKNKFVEQFGGAGVSADESQWKLKFVKSWESRKRRKTVASAFRFVERRRAAAPVVYPGPTPRIWPASNIIGGDYDALPAFPGRPVRGANARIRSVRIRSVPHCNLGGPSD